MIQISVQLFRPAIQDVIDQGSISVEQLGTGADPNIVHSDCVVPFVSDPHSTSQVEDDDERMMSFDNLGSEASIGERDLLRDVSGFLRLET